MPGTSAFTPCAVRGSILAKRAAWTWATSLWSLFSVYCIILLVQVIQRAKSPVQTETFSDDGKVCAAPSIVLCSFGNFNLKQLEFSFETQGGGWYYMSHNVTDLERSQVKNNTQPRETNVTSATILNLTASYSDAHGHTDAYGYTDLITVLNTSGPTLAGIVRSVSSDKNVTTATSGYYAGLRNNPWCVMWTFYRYYVPPDSEPARDNLDTGADAERQFTFTQAYKVTLNLNGDNAGTSEGTVEIPYVWTQVVDFPGNRTQEWLTNSLSSQYLRKVVSTGNPAGFTLLTLNNRYAMSVQKQVTTAMPWYQQTGWPFSPWPWTDTSYLQTINHVIKSVTPQIVPYNATHPYLYNGFGINSSHGWPLWDHTITIEILRGSTETLNNTYVPALIGFWGNVGGAYTFMMLLYALFFVLKSPLIETELRIPGANVARFLYEHVDTAWTKFRRSRFRMMLFAPQQGHASLHAPAAAASAAPAPSPAATPSPAAAPSPAKSPSPVALCAAATLPPFAIMTPNPRLPAPGRAYLRQRSGGNNQPPV